MDLFGTRRKDVVSEFSERDLFNQVGFSLAQDQIGTRSGRLDILMEINQIDAAPKILRALQGFGVGDLRILVKE